MKVGNWYRERSEPPAHSRPLPQVGCERSEPLTHAKGHLTITPEDNINVTNYLEK